MCYISMANSNVDQKVMWITHHSYSFETCCEQRRFPKGRGTKHNRFEASMAKSNFHNGKYRRQILKYKVYMFLFDGFSSSFFLYAKGN